MDNLEQRISELEDRIKSEKKYLQYTEGQQFYKTQREISELQDQLAKMKLERK